MIGIALGKQGLLLGILDEAVRLVVVLALLVLHDAALPIERRLADRAEQMPHPVALHEQCERQRGVGTVSKKLVRSKLVVPL